MPPECFDALCRYERPTFAIATKRVVAIAAPSLYAGNPESHRHKSSDRTGRAIDIDVLRRGQLRTFTVTPLERPAAKAA
jgi:hypothetical protein